MEQGAKRVAIMSYCLARILERIEPSAPSARPRLQAVYPSTQP